MDFYQDMYNAADDRRRCTADCKWNWNHGYKLIGKVPDRETFLVFDGKGKGRGGRRVD